MNRIKLGDLLQVLECSEVIIKVNGDVLMGGLDEFKEGKHFVSLDSIVSSVWFSKVYNGILIECGK